ncbi:MAG: flavodoxin [Clostridium sp.]|nr:flavodoxin [Clostridium sp.]
MLKKVIITILILLVFIIVCMIIVMKSLNNQKTSKERVLPSKNVDSKKALIIFQPSLSDVTSVMANSISQGLNHGGYEVTLNYPCSNLSTDLSQYSLMIFGSPVYVGKPLTIVTDYMSKIKDPSSKKIILFSTGGDAANKEELNVMENSLNGVKAYKKIKFISSSREKSSKEAYNLGIELSKE